MPEKAGRKKGAPKSQPDAARPEFYSRALDEAEKLDFELASGVEGIDDEIALMRVKIKSLVTHEPDNIRLIMQAANTLSRLVKTRYNITREQKQGLKEAIGNVIRDIALPLGIAVLKD
jgi:hypothetical protein